MRKTRKSSLFLIELIIAILFFSLSAAVCVRLFAASYVTSQQSTYRDAAMLRAQSMAALFQHAQGTPDDLLAFASATKAEDDVYLGEFTQNGAVYPVSLQFAEDARIRLLTIQIAAPNAAEGQAPIVTLQTAVYLPLQLGEGA